MARLSNESIKTLRNWQTIKYAKRNPIVRDMIDTIEALQRENEALLIDGRIKKILYQQMEALQQEIKQLQAEINRQATELMACDALESVIQEKNEEIQKLEMVANSFLPALKEKQQEIEQLRSQNTAIKEMLAKVLKVMGGFDYRANINFTLSDCLEVEKEAKTLLGEDE